MVGKTTLILVLVMIVAVSAATNLVQFQNTESMKTALVKLSQENNRLVSELNEANKTSTLVTGIIGARNNSSLASNATSPSSQVGTNESDATSQSITAVAVKATAVTDGFFQSVRYQGSIMDITVDIRNGGKGLILVNTEIPTGVDFQTSAKTAVKVAQSITSSDLSSKDIIFSITASGDARDLQAVDGGSAGAAMTTLLVLELEGVQKLNRTVLMTGTISPDGSIGPVGAVPEKAQAAGQYGAKLFLVPRGQGVYQSEECDEKRQGPIVYRTCRSEEKPLTNLTEKNFDMKVVEVKTVQEALTYFDS